MIFIALGQIIKRRKKIKIMYYFYCPNCQNELEVDEIPHGAVGNVRGGYGIPIYHYECSKCHNLDAGFMFEREGNIAEKLYYRSVIEMYQGIRGIKVKEG